MQIQLSTSRLWFTVIVPFALGCLLSTAFRSINAILAHPLVEDLSLSPVELGFMTSTFLFGLAAAQIPLGIFLDSFGARKTQAVFFVIGGIGIITFGLASNFWLLALGRVVLGVGMAGGLMAAFKAVSNSVRPEQIPFYNGCILAAGGVGALVATSPAMMLEFEFGWRLLCIGMGCACFLVAALIFIVSRDGFSSNKDRPTLRSEVTDLRSIYMDRFFWRIAPLFVVNYGGFIAMQGLWLGPWLQHVVGLSRQQSAHYLFVTAIAMTIGSLSGGLCSKLASRIKWPLINVIATGTAIRIVIQMLVVSNTQSSHYVVWFLYGYFAQVTLVNYAVIAQKFGSELSGRATTSLNMFLFLFAFLFQFFLGFAIHLLLQSGAVDQLDTAYKVAFSAMVALETIALVWLIVRGWTSRLAASQT